MIRVQVAWRYKGQSTMTVRTMRSESTVRALLDASQLWDLSKGCPEFISAKELRNELKTVA